MLRFIIFILLLVSPFTLFGQDLHVEIEGTETTLENGMMIEFDNFTGETSIAVVDSAQAFQAINDGILATLPMFRGSIEDERSSYSRALLFTYVGVSSYFDTETGTHETLFLVDGDERFSLYGNLYTIAQDTVTEILVVELKKAEWEKISSARNVKFRLAGKVTEIPTSILYQMTRITNKVYELESDVEGEKTGVDDIINQSTPYQLQWEGTLDRSPMVQPLPSNTTNSEGTVTIRFEVNPDGTIGRIIPIRKMNPELEREVMSTLRSWRFSCLPSDVPQEPQWGTITFRFVTD